MSGFVDWWLETTLWGLGAADIAGFVTGALCVWLVVRQHVANFPIGILNNLFFILLFVDRRLYGDVGLQVVYIALGLNGWWLWRHGGADRTELAVGRIRRNEVIGGAVFLVIGTFVLARILFHVGGALPPIDALTTTGSLFAQFLLNRKRLESWYVWLAVDVIYVPLFLSRGLPLISLLYAGFILLCLQGLRDWRRSLAEEASTVPAGGTDPTAAVNP